MRTLDEIVSLLNEAFQHKQIEWDDLNWFARIYNLNFHSGETRFCLFYPKWDKVIKIPRFDNVHTDYSALESENYQKAKELGLEVILLESVLYKTLDNGCNIYIQEKFSYSHCNLPSSTSASEHRKIQQAVNTAIYRRVKNSMPSDRQYDDVWLCRAYQIYGKQFFKKLVQFLLDNRINDLHGNNVGWKNGLPIILDYAGYHEF